MLPKVPIISIQLNPDKIHNQSHILGYEDAYPLSRMTMERSSQFAKLRMIGALRDSAQMQSHIIKHILEWQKI